MKRVFILFSLMVFSAGCATTSPNGRVVNFRTNLDSSHIAYALPSGVRYLSGPPAQTVEFPTHRPFPLSGAIAAVGWGERRDVPQVQISLGALKLARPRFQGEVTSDDWESILQSEEVAKLTDGVSTHIVRDANRTEWLESVVEHGGRVVARSYVRPIAPDTILLLRLNMGEHVTPSQRSEGLSIQSSMLSAIVIEKADRLLSSSAAENLRPIKSPQPTIYGSAADRG